MLLCKSKCSLRDLINIAIISQSSSGLTLKSLVMLWTHYTTSSAVMKRKNKVLTAHSTEKENKLK